MKHKRSVVSIALATLVLVALFAVATTGVSAAGIREPVKASGATVGAPAGSAPAVTGNINGPPFYDYVFVKGYDGALWWQGDGNGWNWQSLGGQMTGDPSAAASYDGLKVTVSVRGTSGAVWTKSSTDGGLSWGTWMYVGGNCAAGTGPGTYMWPSGDRTGWFITDSATKQVMHLYKDNLGNTVGWESLGGVATSSPGATSPSDGGVGVFVRGAGGGCWYRSGYMGGFNGWLEVPGAGVLKEGTGPAATYEPWNYQVDVFVTGVSGGLWQQVVNTANGNWNAGWTARDGVLTSSPTANAYWGFGTPNIDVLARANDGNVWINGWSPVPGWVGWDFWDTGP